jgi:hypothetical protein
MKARSTKGEFFNNIKQSTMKPQQPLSGFFVIIFFAALLFSGCSSHEKESPEKTDHVEANKKMYTHVWDEILNKGKLEMFNDSNWVKSAVVHASPKDILGH